MRVVLNSKDERAFHIIHILGAQVGSSLYAGLIDGLSGKAVVESISDGFVSLSLCFNLDGEGLFPLTLVVGLSRPPTIKKILKEASALGVCEFVLCGTENSEKSYRQSKLFRDEALQRVLIEGAQQAGSTSLPRVSIKGNLSKALAGFSRDDGANLLALDNNRPSISLTDFWRKAGSSSKNSKTVLAVGSERGWTNNELDNLEDAGFTLCRMGQRVLRVETAAIAGCAICLSGAALI